MKISTFLLKMATSVFAFSFAHAYAQANLAVNIEKTEQIKCRTCMNTKPTDKDVINIIFASLDIPLKGKELCDNAGAPNVDKTIGHYLSNYIAQMTNTRANNYLLIETEEVDIAKSQKGWQIRFYVGQKDGEWLSSNGIEFVINRQDGSVIAQSYRCIGTP